MNRHSNYLYSVDGSEEFYSRRDAELMVGGKRIENRKKNGALKKVFLVNGHTIEIKKAKVWDGYIDGVLKIQAADSLKSVASALNYAESTVESASKKPKRARGISVKMRYQDITLPQNVVVG